jgi:hypothetical protein
MAININTVYQTTLLLLNKEQRGYLTPAEFNSIATQVQLDIFENYFEELNQQLRVPQADVDYSDRIMNLDEKISIFKVFGDASYQDGTGQAVSPLAITNLATFTVIITKPFISVGSVVTGTGIPAGTTVTSFNNGILTLSVAVTIFANTTLTFTGSSTSVNYFSLPNQSAYSDFNSLIPGPQFQNNVHKLGTVIYTDNFGESIESQRLTRNDFYNIERSKLTKSTESFPTYLYENEKLYVNPKSIVTNLSVDYIRKPSNPYWGFTPGNLGQYVYDGNAFFINPNTGVITGSTQFDLHESEQVDVILKVLKYAGLIIEDATVIQVASQELQQNELNSKS